MSGKSPWFIIGGATLIPLVMMTGVNLFRGDINPKTIIPTSQQQMVETPTNIEVVKHVEDDTIYIPGEPGSPQNPSNPTPPEDTGLTPDDSQLIQIFREAGASEAKAYGLMACYKACTECGMSSFEVLGLLGCGMCEGTPGLVQYNHTLGGQRSTQSNPLFVDTVAKADLAIAGNYSADTGAGTAQWTNGRFNTYASVCKPYLSNTQLPECHKTLWKADYDMYKLELNGSYRSLITNIGSHNSTLEAVVVYSMFKYEAGFGHYRNNDTIAAYTGTRFKSYLDNRYAAAQTIERVFRDHGILR